MIKKVLLIFGILIAIAGIFTVTVNLSMIRKGNQRILSEEKAAGEKAEVILILGAGVWDGGVPSHMLKDRLEEGIRLYENGTAKKLLVSGDHGSEGYDEVNVMKQYLIDAGIPGEDIFMDHAGFSTYESMYRAKAVFGVKKAIVVTQQYHMYRALYICDRLGIEAYGVSADPRRYAGELYRNLREWIARDKDVFSCLLKVPPKYLGERIDITGSGDVTNDR